MIGSALKRIRIARGMSQVELAAYLGLGQTTVADYELDKRDPRPDGLVDICRKLEVTPNYLYGFSDEIGAAVRPVPILGVIRAGKPLLAEENWDEQIEVGQYERGVDFALRVTGDSMIYAGIHQGDIVLMKQADRAQSGDVVAAVLQDGDQLATLKFFLEGYPPVLRAANPRYTDQVMTRDHRIIGVCTGLVRSGVPSLRDYQSMLNVAENLGEEWEGLITEATSAGIKAEEFKALLEMMKKARK